MAAVPGVQQGLPTTSAQGSFLPGAAGIYPCKQQGSLPGCGFAAKCGWCVCIPQHRAHIPSSLGQQRPCLLCTGISRHRACCCPGIGCKVLSCFPDCYCSQRIEGKKGLHTAGSTACPEASLAALGHHRKHCEAPGSPSERSKVGLWGFFPHVLLCYRRDLTQLCSDHPTEGFLIYDTQSLAMIHHRNTSTKTSSYLLAGKQESHSDLASPLSACIQHPTPGPT